MQLVQMRCIDISRCVGPFLLYLEQLLQMKDACRVHGWSESFGDVHIDEVKQVSVSFL